MVTSRGRLGQAHQALSASMALATLCLTGCVSVTVESPVDFQGERNYWGWVRVAAPRADRPDMQAQRIKTLDVSTWGLRVGQGLSVGYLHDQVISVPLDCRIVFIIRDSAELRHAQSLLQQLGQEPLCTTTTQD